MPSIAEMLAEIDGYRRDIRDAINTKDPGAVPAGTPLSEYADAVLGIPAGGGGSVQLDAYLIDATGNTTLPADYTDVFAEAIGSGAAGGAGRYQATANANGGNGGGSGGYRSGQWTRAALEAACSPNTPASIRVVIGAAVTGPAGNTTGNGASGSNGNPTLLYVRDNTGADHMLMSTGAATGGQGGVGSNAAPTNVSCAGGHGAGSPALTTAGSGPGVTAAGGPPGGGSGGGFAQSSNQGAPAGGDGAGAVGGAALGADPLPSNGNAGSNASNSATSPLRGGGGGGGGRSSRTSGQASGRGGHGGFPGGGGGGGAGSRGDQNGSSASGAGGDGAAGQARLVIVREVSA